MNLLRVGVAGLNQTPLDWEGNRDRILAALAEARAQGIDLLTLPELCITGYGCEDAFHSPSVDRAAWEMLEAVAAETVGMVVCVGLPVVVNAAVYDAAALLVNGQIVGLVAKRHLAGDGVHYEPRWFKPWPIGARTVIVRKGRRYPMGDLFFEVGGVRIGFEICEEAWVARRPGAELAHRGVDVVLNPSGSHFAFGKREVRERFVVDGSRAFGVAYLYANLVGNEAGRILYDGAGMVASGGSLLACAPMLCFSPVTVTGASVDIDVNRTARARTASVIPNPAVDEAEIVRVDFDWPRREPVRAEPPCFTWELGPRSQEETFTRAVALGLFDYLAKSGLQGFAVSLSGGADSTAVATLCALSLRFALAELGVEGVRRRLGRVRVVQSTDDVGLWSKALLTTVYQGTANSSAQTRAAAAAVAASLGCTHHAWEVDSLVEGYVARVSEALGRPIGWQTDDIAMQNIQARVRSPGIWLLANIEGKLLLSTSNRSEAAVGYATMDGDTSGGLSPIAGIDKAFLRRWLVWMSEEGPQGIGPLPGLRAVAILEPSAELRPLDQRQTDEDDLMPYPILDAIERAAIRDKLDPIEVFRRICVYFPEHGPEQVRLWVDRFFRLFCANQWKRERYAPSFHLDDENLDPRSWCRFPILSGGYARELRALAEGERR